MTFEIRCQATLPNGARAVLAPGGLETPHSRMTGTAVDGGTAHPT